MDSETARWWFLLAAYHLALAGHMPASRDAVFRTSRVPSPPHSAARLARSLVEDGLLHVEGQDCVDLSTAGQSLCETLQTLGEEQREILKKLAQATPTTMLLRDVRQKRVWEPLVTCGLLRENGRGNLLLTQAGRALSPVLVALDERPFVTDCETNLPDSDGADRTTGREARRSDAMVKKLLPELFTVDEMRRLVAATLEPALQRELVEGSVSPNQYAHELVEALGRQGRLGDLLTAVLAERPLRAVDVAAIRRLLALESEPAT